MRNVWVDGGIGACKGYLLALFGFDQGCKCAHVAALWFVLGDGALVDTVGSGRGCWGAFGYLLQLLVADFEFVFVFHCLVIVVVLFEMK